MKNFLIKQYQKDIKFKISHNYLPSQFENHKKILLKIEKLLKNCDFTLGEEVLNLENKFKKITKTKYAFGVGSGTDALFLSLKALNLSPGDEVITPSYTFYATVGAIVTAGLKPVFCDIGEDLNINVSLLEKKITKKTKVIMPVHWAGKVCDMDNILRIAKKYKIFVIEDACHAVGAHYNGKKAGSFGISGCFSFHPLKNINVWGDGGIVCTNNKEFAKKIELLRNHGLISRNECKIFGFNSRLDTIQAIVANYLIKKKLNLISKKRISNALYLDKSLSKFHEIDIPERANKKSKEVFHLYQIKVKNQLGLYSYLRKRGIDAKIHYPIPMHMQPAYKNKFFDDNKDLKITNRIVNEVISLPVHEFITKKQLDYIINSIFLFFRKC
jgi:dTDP-4-amino-4,6-dideoxygalactose transaminase